MSTQDPVQRAIRLARAGRRREARILIRHTLEANPNNASAWALLAHLVYNEKDPAKTIYCLEQLVRLQPDNLRAQEHLHYLKSPVWKRYRGEEGSSVNPLLEAEGPPAESMQPSERSIARRVLVAALRSAAVLAGILIILWLISPNVPMVRESIALLSGETASVSAADLAAGTPMPTLRPRDGILGLLSFPPITGLRPAPAPPGPPTPTPTVAPTTTPLPPTLAPAGPPVDYQPLYNALVQLRDGVTALSNYDLGIAFVDIDTGQTVQIDGYSRYHAMSTFKGPLAVYYLWSLEQGLIVEAPQDRRHITRMLEYSSNPDTTCIIERVGGIAAFNDWLAYIGFTRENNFVLKWGDWGCFDSGAVSTPQPDWRYSRGDETLGLPGGSALLGCPIPQMPCDKAFAPAELALFYARLYRGEIISPASTGLLLAWMEEDRSESIFLQNLPEDAAVHAYIKGGTQQANDEYRENFISEAGLIQTPNGTFALAVFMQRNPEWPGSWPISEAARISYEYYVQTHPPAR